MASRKPASRTIYRAERASLNFDSPERRKEGKRANVQLRLAWLTRGGANFESSQKGGRTIGVVREVGGDEDLHLEHGEVGEEAEGGEDVGLQRVLVGDPPRALPPNPYPTIASSKGPSKDGGPEEAEEEGASRVVVGVLEAIQRPLGRLPALQRRRRPPLGPVWSPNSTTRLQEPSRTPCGSSMTRRSFRAAQCFSNSSRI